ncbi:50S ribosomal protein L21 [Candidatus Shapirobacteria bacterium]|nr:50S ribosomal protein L21 [Candidatus Shapirobacteria bacterium]
MKYAVIAVSGTQYLVKEDEVITVDNQNLEIDKSNKLETVLLTVDGDKVSVGTPTVKGSSVEYTVVNNYQGKKVDVFKFKSKSRYRKSMGFRPQLTDIKINKINL